MFVCLLIRVAKARRRIDQTVEVRKRQIMYGLFELHQRHQPVLVLNYVLEQFLVRRVKPFLCHRGTPCQ